MRIGIYGSYFEALHYFYRSYTKYQLARPELRIVARNRSQFYRDMWVGAAHHLGADIVNLGGEFYEISKSGKRVWTCQAETSLANLIDLQFTGNRPLIANVLSELNVPIPRYKEFERSGLVDAMAFLLELGKPAVVKPSAGTGGGNSIVTNVTSRSAFLKAAANARVSGSRMYIEEQIDGENYRLLYLDGELTDCVCRKAPVLIGDGRSTLRQLVHKENQERLTIGSNMAQSLLSIDQDMINTLAAQGLRLSSLPRTGQQVAMKDVINQNRREDNEPALDSLHESIAEMGARIIRKIGGRVVGIDIITRDLRVPLEESGGVVLEVNSPPGLYYHNRRTEDGALVVAVEILRRGLSLT